MGLPRCAHFPGVAFLSHSVWLTLRDPGTLGPIQLPRDTPVPLLVALDEYDAALRAVSIHAQLGLAAGSSGHAEAALRAIQVVCEKVSATVEDVLSHPEAVSQVCVIEGGLRGKAGG